MWIATVATTWGLLALAASSPVPSPASPAEVEVEVEVAASPRAALQDFLNLCRAGRYEEAGRYVAEADDPAPASLRARRLKAVLDRWLWIDLSSVANAPEGDLTDGLPADTEQIGTIPDAGGQAAPVRLVRRESRWTFTRGTVARVDRWYAALGDRWLRERLPEVLWRPGPLDLVWWQWMAVPLVLLLAWSIGRFLSATTVRGLRRLLARTRTDLDDLLAEALRGPTALALSLALAWPAVLSLGLHPPAHALARKAFETVLLVALFWALWSAVGVAGRALRLAPWARGSPSVQSLLSIGVRLGHVAVLAAGVVATLSHLGYPVAGLLAGLGLGGLAFALAAQKTVENLFGSISLAIDAPFRVGDFVKVEDFVGTVESLGLRSTQIRTLDRTLVTIPNGRLADMRLESFTARDRLRLACSIGLEYGTSAAQLRQVIEGLEGALRAHPLIWPDAVVVRFKGFGPSSLDVEVMAWFLTSDWSRFLEIRQDMLIQFMEIVERAGTSFAFPTQTVHLVDGGGTQSGRRDGAREG